MLSFHLKGGCFPGSSTFIISFSAILAELICILNLRGGTNTFDHKQVVDAVNCARRGWINVDMDILACEVCGTRLQFSTPSAWNQQQGMFLLFASASFL